jgi:hypothetical protein
MSTVNGNYYGGIVKDGLVLLLDAAKRDSYPRVGTTWTDITWNGNNGTLTNFGSQTIWNGDNGGSIVFDGTNKYVSVAKQNYFVGVTQFSMCAWMKRTLSSTLIVISQVESLSNDISFELWSDGYAYFEVGNGSNSYGRVLNSSTSWQFLSMVYNGTLVGNSNRLKGYINGVEQTLDFGATTIPATTGTVNANFILGSYLSGLNYGSGNISNVQTYNRALSASEVLQNYNALKGRYGL